tara:strand:- start:3402 stop:4397 length:996 start_codon:yes stop_codon:yes gene_type:complete
VKVFLTGATGYIGNRLAMYLAENNYQVHALVRNLKSDNIPVHPNILLFEGNLNDNNSIEKAVNTCDYVFHTAAFTKLTCCDVKEFYNVNVQGTANVLNAAKKYGVKKLIFTSSVSVYGPSQPNSLITEIHPRMSSYANDYELTKTLAENLVLEYNKKGLPGIILNISRVYGPGNTGFSNGVNRFISMLLKKRIVFVPSKLQIETNYVYINDVVKAHDLALKNGIAGEKYIIGGENASYEKLFTTISESSQTKNSLVKINYMLLRTALFLKSLFDNLVLNEPSLTPKLLDYLFTNRIVSSQKAVSQLGYEITALKKGMEQTLMFLKNRNHEN